MTVQWSYTAVCMIFCVHSSYSQQHPPIFYFSIALQWLEHQLPSAWCNCNAKRTEAMSSVCADLLLWFLLFVILMQSVLIGM